MQNEHMWCSMFKEECQKPCLVCPITCMSWKDGGLVRANMNFLTNGLSVLRLMRFLIHIFWLVGLGPVLHGRISSCTVGLSCVPLSLQLSKTLPPNSTQIHSWELETFQISGLKGYSGRGKLPRLTTSLVWADMLSVHKRAGKDQPIDFSVLRVWLW